jgi:hypothetical protein
MTDTSLDLDALQRAVNGLRSQQASVQRERAELQSMKAVVDENLSKFKQRVKLNVGGTRFETTLSTLTRHPDSMLAAMFSGRHDLQPDDEGYVFIDRDGTHFRVILNFLRTGVLDVPSAKAADELKRELEYYQLPCESVTSLTSTNRGAAVRAVHTVRNRGEDRNAHITRHAMDVSQICSQDAANTMQVVAHDAKHVGPLGQENIYFDKHYLYTLLQAQQRPTAT